MTSTEPESFYDPDHVSLGRHSVSDDRLDPVSAHMSVIVALVGFLNFAAIVGAGPHAWTLAICWTISAVPAFWLWANGVPRTRGDNLVLLVAFIASCSWIAASGIWFLSGIPWSRFGPACLLIGPFVAWHAACAVSMLGSLRLLLSQGWTYEPAA